MQRRIPYCVRFEIAERVQLQKLQFISVRIPKTSEYQVFSQKVIKKLSSKTLQISRDDFDDIDQQWESILVNLRRINTQTLIFSSSLNSNILKQIKQIKFPSLIYLDLTSNNICSIEALMKMNMVMLESLNLNDNNITSAQPLGYCDFPRLKSLFLENNQFNEISFVKHLNSQCLESVQLQTDYYSNNLSVSIRDFLFINIKCPLRQIGIQNRNSRIEQPQLYQMLCEKFPNLKSKH